MNLSVLIQLDGGGHIRIDGDHLDIAGLGDVFALLASVGVTGTVMPPAPEIAQETATQPVIAADTFDHRAAFVAKLQPPIVVGHMPGTEPIPNPWKCRCGHWPSEHWRGTVDGEVRYRCWLSGCDCTVLLPPPAVYDIDGGDSTPSSDDDDEYEPLTWGHDGRNPPKTTHWSRHEGEL
jgi:hypothetical protein